MRSTQRKQSFKEFTKARYSHPASSKECPQTNQSRLPRESTDLRRRFQELRKGQKDLVHQETWGELESLTISLGSSGQYWIALKGTGKPFIREPFTQPEFCYEAALELEDTFDILQVVELRPPDAIERIKEIVDFYLDRERALLA